jgi:F-type H+/Na+-transporting ATPase subunit beta
LGDLGEDATDSVTNLGHCTVWKNVMAQTQAIDGRVIAVRGAVLDVAFDGTALPPIDEALLVMTDKGAPIIAEVQSHLDEATVRAIALQSTAGLRRGVVAHATGGPLEVPVGEAVLGRLLDLTVAVGDKGKPFAADVIGNAVSEPPPSSADSFAERSSRRECSPFRRPRSEPLV